MDDLIAIIPLALAATSAAITIWNTINKLRTRRDLSIALQTNSELIGKIRTHLANKKINSQALDALIGELVTYTDTLPPNLLSQVEKEEARTALSQPSTSGRESYLRALVDANS